MAYTRTALDDIITAIRRKYKSNEDAQKIAMFYKLGMITLKEATEKITALPEEE